MNKRMEIKMKPDLYITIWFVPELDIYTTTYSNLHEDNDSMTDAGWVLVDRGEWTHKDPKQGQSII